MAVFKEPPGMRSHCGRGDQHECPQYAAMTFAREGNSVTEAVITGPLRPDRNDRYYLHTTGKSGWTIAVSEGIGTSRAARAAAQAAADALPGVIDGREAMARAFSEADDAVKYVRSGNEESRTSLSIASWSPEGGLWVGWSGDSVVAVMPSSNGHGWSSIPHLDSEGRITGYLGPVQNGAVRAAPTILGEGDVAGIIGRPDPGGGVGRSAVLVATSSIWSALIDRAARCSLMARGMCEGWEAISSHDRARAAGIADAVERAVDEQRVVTGIGVDGCAVGAVTD